MPHEALNGVLRALALPDILEFLKISGKTGVLTLTRGEAEKRLHVKDGNVVFAASNLPEDRLGSFLLREGAITQAQYDETTAMLKATGRRQGRLLVEIGALTPQGLWDAVRRQVREIVYSLFDWEDGRFHFDEGPLPKEEAITVDVDITELVVGGIRRIRSRACLDSWAPNRSVVLELHVPLDTPVKFEEYERHIMGLVDGVRTVEHIIETSEIGAFETMKVLYMLASIGYVTPKRGSMAAGAPSTVETTRIMEASSNENDDARIEALVREYNTIFNYLHRCMAREIGPLAAPLFGKYFSEIRAQDEEGFFEGVNPSADAVIPERLILENAKHVQGTTPLHRTIEARLQGLVDRQIRGLRHVLGEEHARRAESALQGLRMKL